MTDLSKTIEPKSDQLNADDLIAGPRTITVTDVRGVSGDAQPISIHYEGDNGKPYKPCKSMRRVLVVVWGASGADYAGRSMTLYRDPNVKFGGIAVGGIRISHMSHINDKVTMSLTVSRANRKPYTVNPLKGADQNTTATGQNVDPAAAAAAALIAAQNAAAGGTSAFQIWWNTDEGKEARSFLTSDMEDLKKICKEADDQQDQSNGEEHADE